MTRVTYFIFPRTEVIAGCVVAAAGAVGPASVQVRSVGGGEPWDDVIDLIPALSNNETIAGVLSGRDVKHRAISGVDYIQLDTTLDFTVSSSSVSVNTVASRLYFLTVIVISLYYNKCQLQMLHTKMCSTVHSHIMENNA